MSKICSFCGHSTAPQSIKPVLAKAIDKLIADNLVDCFYVGNHGGFDRMVLSILKEKKKANPQIRFFVILAYIPGKKDEYDPYENVETIYPDGLEAVPKRYAITHRNRWMVNRSSYLIAYVSHGYGGAAQTLQYAKTKKEISIINIATTEQLM